MASLFTSAAGKEAILELYDQKLAGLPFPCESLYVDTSFGETHLLRTGDLKHPPLLLVHGSNGCAPIALDCYPQLRSQYQVFAIDVPAQPNKSAETRLSMKDDSYGKWMHEVLEKLGVTDVVLAGFSFGGLIILKALTYSEKHVKEAFLASPAYIVNGNPIQALLKIFIPMRRYMKTQKMEYIERFLSAVFTDRDPFAVRFLSKVFLHFDMDFTPVPVITKKEAKKINTPISILGAGHDILFPGRKMRKRANNIFPSLKRFDLLEESKHVQNEAGNRMVEKLILGDK
jgi:pimeloyl-ACP methyl ester carboxylesterase